MSRYVVHAPPHFGEVVFGWDDAMSSFFLQCFAVDQAQDSDEDRDEGPVMWCAKRTLAELEHELRPLGVQLPPLLCRMLVAEQHSLPLPLAEGDPVLCGRRPCILVQRLRTFARVRWPNGDEQMCIAAELEPDVSQLGVEHG